MQIASSFLVLLVDRFHWYGVDRAVLTSLSLTSLPDEFIVAIEKIVFAKSISSIACFTGGLLLYNVTMAHYDTDVVGRMELSHRPTCLPG